MTKMRTARRGAVMGIDLFRTIRPTRVDFSRRMRNTITSLQVTMKRILTGKIKTLEIIMTLRKTVA